MFSPSHSTARAILTAGFIAGTIDIGAACVIYSVGPVVILKAIAVGVLGPASYRGGAAAAILGLALQWLMSWIIAAIYCVAATHMPIMRSRWIPAGLAYGVVVFVVMHYVVVPLSAVGHRPSFTAATFAGNLLAMFLFGLIIAFVARSAPRKGAES